MIKFNKKKGFLANPRTGITRVISLNSQTRPPSSQKLITQFFFKYFFYSTKSF
jgi:hypothetical protein